MCNWNTCSECSSKIRNIIGWPKASGTTSVIEPASSRDHTERMLKAFGADISIRGELGRNVVIKSGSNLIGQRILVPET